MKKLIVAIFTIAITTGSGFCDNTTGAAFLKIGVGGRISAMGSAATAIVDDASAIYWNPAGTADLPLKEDQVMFMHSQWLQDTTYEFAGFVHPTSNGALGLAVSYLGWGSIEGRDDNRQLTNSFSASDTAAYLSKSVRSSWGSYGANIKLIQQRIETEQASGLAGDVGCKIYRSSSPLSFGLSIQNLGPQMHFISDGFNVPLSITAGTGYYFCDNLLVSADLRRELYENRNSIAFGAEYVVASIVSLRAGYLTKISETASGSDGTGNGLLNYAGLGGGIGVQIHNLHFDYAMVPYGALGVTQRISITASFK